MTTPSVSTQLRQLADRLDEEGEGALDFGDEMLRQTIQDEVARVMATLPKSMPVGYWSDEAHAEWYQKRAEPVATAICVLLNDLSQDKTEPTKPTPIDFNDTRITSGRGDGKP